VNPGAAHSGGLDVLFVNPLLTSGFFSMPGKEIPLSLCLLAAQTRRHGYRVAIHDAHLDGWDPARFARIVTDARPRVIGLTSYTVNVERAAEMAAVAKAVMPEALTVLGGFHASVLPERTLAEFAAFDAVVVGEGERTILSVLDPGGLDPDHVAPGLVVRRDGGAARGARAVLVEDLDDLPFADRGLLPLRRYVPSPGNYVRLPTSLAFLSRGCPYRCRFCSNRVFGHRVRYRSTGNLLAEIEREGRDRGLRDFRFADEGMTIDRERLLDFCDEVRRRRLRFHWSCYSRVDRVDAEALGSMKRAGCYQVMFGVESGNAETLERTVKAIDRGKSRAAILEARRAGIEVKASFVIGFPWETPDAVRETIRFARGLRPDFVYFNVFKPFPGSALFDEMSDRREIREAPWSAYFTGDASDFFATRTPAPVLKRLVRAAAIGFYLRPTYVGQVLFRLLRHPARMTRVLAAGAVFLARQSRYVRISRGA
jgi:radical SAM superfamily enzyme YgiQ (UPF0313 family)